MRKKQIQIWQKIGGNLIMESEIGVMWPWANEWESPPETGEENGFSSEFPSGRTALLTAVFHPRETDFGVLASKPVREYILLFQATKSVASATES